MTDELVHLDVADGVGTITLDSPANRNALSAQLRAELRSRLEQAIADSGVRVIVLTHTGPVFCAGMDLKEVRSPSAGGRGPREFPAILDLIWHSPTPVVARLAGPARAGGTGLVAACDLAVAADTTTYAFTEVRLGLVPAVISVVLLPRLDRAGAHELFLTGETFSAQRAVDIGLLTAAVPASALDAGVTRYVDMLRLGAPSALAATKRLLRTESFSEQFTAMQELSARFFASEEGQEGARSFAEKRRPSWVATS